jgi:hypothetical protein
MSCIAFSGNAGRIPCIRSGIAAAMVGAGVFAASAHAQLSYGSLFTFPRVSAEGDNIVSAQRLWQTGPQSFIFLSTASAGGNGLWESSPSSFTRIVKSFQALPGLPGGMNVNSTVAWVAGNGDVWFTGTTNPGSVGRTWRRTAAGFSPVLENGQIAPVIGGTITNVGTSAIGADGTGYVSAAVQDAVGNSSSVLYRLQGSNYQPIAQKGQIVPGLGQPLVTAGVKRVLPDGRAIMGIDTGTTVAVSILPGDGVSTLASAGVVPSLTGYQPAAVSPGGGMLLQNVTVPRVLSVRDTAGTITEIARQNAALPGVPGWTLGSNVSALGVSDAGRAVFSGQMGPSGDLRMSIGITSPTGVTPIFRSGEGLTGGQFDTSAMFASDFNALGQVAIQAPLVINSVITPAVYAWDPVVGPIRVAAPGDQLLVDGVMRTINAAQLLNATAESSRLAGPDDTGSLSMYVSFVGGPAAIIRTTIPTPSVVAIMAVGSMVAGGRRRRPLASRGATSRRS